MVVCNDAKPINSNLLNLISKVEYSELLAFEGDSKVYFYEGTYSEYEENKKMRLGNVEPKKFKYKKLME